MPKVTQLVVTAENKPGALAHVCSTLGQAGVNISAVLAAEIQGKGKLRLVVDNPDKGREALKAAKMRVSEEEAIAVSLKNKPGAFAEVTQKLAQAKINIKYAYATVAEGSTKATVILGVPNVDKALGVLGG